MPTFQSLQSSICREFFDVINDKRVGRGFLLDQLQTELFLQRDGLRRKTNLVRGFSVRRHVLGPKVEHSIVTAREPVLSTTNNGSPKPNAPAT